MDNCKLNALKIDREFSFAILSTPECPNRSNNCFFPFWQFLMEANEKRREKLL